MTTTRRPVGQHLELERALPAIHAGCIGRRVQAWSDEAQEELSLEDRFCRSKTASDAIACIVPSKQEVSRAILSGQELHKIRY